MRQEIWNNYCSQRFSSPSFTPTWTCLLFDGGVVLYKRVCVLEAAQLSCLTVRSYSPCRACCYVATSSVAAYFQKNVLRFWQFDTVYQYKTLICTQNGLQFMTNINAIEHLCCVTLHMLRHKNAFKQKHLKHTCSSPRLSESLQR